MDDLLESLKRLEIPCRHILVNMVLPETGCNFCESKRKEQIEIIAQIDKERSSQYRISKLPLLAHQIKGVERVRKFADKIYG